MAFNTEVSYYAGSITNKDTHIAKFLVNGVEWVISMIEKTNPDMLPLFAKTQVLNNSATTLTLATNAKILDVVRINADSSGEALKCSPINPAYRSNAANTDSIYYASVNSPVYYIDSTSGTAPVLTVLPTPEATQTATISIVLPDSSIAADATAIDNFPSSMYHAVILYAAGQLLHHKMSEVNAKLPTDLDADTTPFNAITDVAGSISLISLPTFANASKSLPSTISVASSLPADYAISTSLPTLSISTGHNAEYLDALASAKALIDVDMADDDGGVAQSAAYWLADEDEEMTQATLATAAQELQRASSYLGKFQADINKEVQQFTVDMQKYQAEIAEEQAKAQLAAEKVQSELAVDSTIASTDVAIYQAEMQREQTRFNAEITKYQADVQGKMESLNYELQEWNANVQKSISLYTTVIGKLTTDYQWLQGQYQVVKAELSEFMTPYTTPGNLDSTVEGVRR